MQSTFSTVTLLLVIALLLSECAHATSQSSLYPRDYLEHHIGSYPCEGMLIYDIASIPGDVGLTGFIVKSFTDLVNELQPDFIAATEARAWLFSTAIALNTNKPHISIRKKGKFPKTAPLLSETYGMSYADGVTIEMIDSPSYKGKTVVIFDDGISSGGTTLGTIRLLEQAGMRVIAVLAVVQHHYRDLMPEYAPWMPLTHTLFDLGTKAK